MRLASDKTLYSDQLSDVHPLVWSDDLASGTSVAVYRGNLKQHPLYRDNKDRLYVAYLVYVVDEKPDTLEVYKDREDGSIYLSEGQFDSYWEYIRASIRKGIINRGGNKWSITMPEELLDLRLLEKHGVVPIVEAGNIVYVSRMLISHDTSRYFTIEGNNFYHDRDCSLIKNTASKGFAKIPEGYEPCPACQRRMILRSGVEDKDLDKVYSFIDLNVPNTLLEHLIGRKGARFSFYRENDLLITTKVDKFRIKRTIDGRYILLHNNYVILSGTDRILSDRYHKQKNCGKTMESMLNYINWYDYKAGHRAVSSKTELGKQNLIERIAIFIRKLAKDVSRSCNDIRKRARELRLNRSIDRLISSDHRIVIWKNDGETCVEFDNAAVKGEENDIVGIGSNVEEAGRDYLRKLEGKTLVFSDRSEMRVL